MPETYMFCSGKIRPAHCVKQTNLCCFRCDKNAECQKANSGTTVKPCTAANIDSDEVCEFHV